ncbi:hypothetical protein B296_00014079, partial [Ensete ventricosum]
FEFRSVFHAPSRKFKMFAIPDVLAHGTSYEHGFAKKYDGHKLCVKSHVELCFDRFFVHHLGNLKYYHSRCISPWEVVRALFRQKTQRSETSREVARRVEVEFRSILRATSQKLKILAIPYVFGHGKSYEHGFLKKYDNHKLCAKSCIESSFDRFFMHLLGNSKCWPFPTYKPMVS